MTDIKTKQIPEALTFDDISLLPDYSEVLPMETSVETMLTRDIPLEDTPYQCRHGHGHRSGDGHQSGARGRHWLHSPEHVDRAAGLRR